MAKNSYGKYTQKGELTQVKKRMAKAPVHKAIAVMDTNDKLVSLIWDNTDKRNGRKSLLNTIRMITMFANGTGFKTACELSGLNYRSCERWRQQEWFLECVKIARDRIDYELDNKFTGIIQTGADKLADQLKNGDFVRNKDGSLDRMPVNSKDTAIITSIMFDKRNLLRGKPTGITENKSNSERLTELQERFKQFANATEVEGEIIEQEAE